MASSLSFHRLTWCERLYFASRRQTAEELLVEADVAMYAAKEAGRDRATVYSAPSAVPVMRAERT